jgi:hypothetical protein
LLDEVTEERVFDACQLEKVDGISKHERYTANVLKCEGKCSDNAALQVRFGTECLPSRRSGSFCQFLRSLGFVCENRVFVIDVVALDIAYQST